MCLLICDITVEIVTYCYYSQQQKLENTLLNHELLFVASMASCENSHNCHSNSCFSLGGIIIS